MTTTRLKEAREMLDKIKTISALTKGRKTSADWREAIAELEAQRSEVGQQVSHIESKRERVLLDGSAADLRKLDEEMADCDLALARIAARLDELRPRLADAERTEKAKKIDRLRSDAAAAYGEFLDAWAVAVAAAQKVRQARIGFDAEGVGMALNSFPYPPPQLAEPDLLEHQRRALAEFASGAA